MFLTLLAFSPKTYAYTAEEIVVDLDNTHKIIKLDSSSNKFDYIGIQVLAFRLIYDFDNDCSHIDYLFSLVDNNGQQIDYLIDSNDRFYFQVIDGDQFNLVYSDDFIFFPKYFSLGQQNVGPWYLDDVLLEGGCTCQLEFIVYQTTEDGIIGSLTKPIVSLGNGILTFVKNGFKSIFLDENNAVSSFGVFTFTMLGLSLCIGLTTVVTKIVRKKK